MDVIADNLSISQQYFDGLVQDGSYPSALAMGLLQSYTNPTT